jgi:MOSC domain-containing protein YiiM/ferredoxin-NADP reductase/ferredoxin
MAMARLVSVNVGLPRDVDWHGRTVHTAIWKSPVPGRCRARRLNLEGDGQGDIAGHGGEQRAVLVYQLESYRYWQEQLTRTEFVHGQFGENFTVEGLADDAVCIGDRYRIGSAVFEVSQPRVTCYRVGIRLSEPRMPALLTSAGRPGFYCRVLEEGEVGAGDEIAMVGQAAERMTIAEINALLYSPNHPRDRLERAVALGALSPGWRASFEALLQSQTKNAATRGNAGLVPSAAAHPVAAGFHPVTIAAVDRDGEDVVSLTLQTRDGQPLPPAEPGQFVAVRLPTPGRPALFRSYSLSGPAGSGVYRISVKIEPHGAAGLLVRALRVGDGLDVSLPRGSFTLRAGERPIVLLSAGIGATPVIAMLHALAESRSPRQVLWLYQARDRQHHPFADEVRRMIAGLAHGRSYVCYSRPGATDRMAEDFDSVGRLSHAVLETLGLPRTADVYVCGPARFITDMKAALVLLGIAAERIYVERFAGGESLMPGVVGAVTRAPHPPEPDATAGALVSFARSGVAAHWNAAAYGSLLELAEACDVPVRWSCRAGVCHNCESGLVSGEVVYGPEPLDRPADGNLLLCCSQPVGDIVIDL